MTTKNKFIDFLKGIAIILVLYGHCLQYGSGSAFLNTGMYWNDPIMKAIYSFHMPLFISISGYLYFFSFSKDAMGSVRKRVKNLLPICGTWAVLISVREMAIGNVISLKSIVKLFFTDFWFLWSVIICVCVVATVEGLVHEKFRMGGTAIAYIMIFLLFFVTPDGLWMNAHKFMLPFFVAGFYYAKKETQIASVSWTPAR